MMKVKKGKASLALPLRLTDPQLGSETRPQSQGVATGHGFE